MLDNNTMFIARVYMMEADICMHYIIKLAFSLIVLLCTISHTHAGPPSPPEPKLLVLSATAIQISWLPPFSWEEYPIVNYTVQVHNRNTGEVINSIVNVTITEALSSAVTREMINSTLSTATESGSATIIEEEMNSTTNAAFTSATAVPVTFIHNTPHKGVVQNCEELVFSVSAANNIGWGSPAVVTGGFPMGNVCPIPLYLLVSGDYEGNV